MRMNKFGVQSNFNEYDFPILYDFPIRESSNIAGMKK